MIDYRPDAAFDAILWGGFSMGRSFSLFDMRCILVKIGLLLFCCNLGWAQADERGQRSGLLERVERQRMLRREEMAALQRNHLRIVRVDPETRFEMAVFGGGVGADAERQRLEFALQRHVGTAKQRAGLSEEQAEELLLAGRGDIKRFLNRVAQAVRQYDAVAPDNDVLNQLRELALPLQQELSSGIFGSSSLFHKVLQRTLTEEQAARLQLSERNEEDREFMSAVHSYLISAQKAVDLDADQYLALEELLVQTLDRSGMSQDYRNYLVTYRVSQIPEERFADFLSDDQIETLSQSFAHARALEPFLRRQGWIKDDNPKKEGSGDGR